MITRTATPEDLPKLLAIYNDEVKNGVATFDTEPLTLKERKVWFDAHNTENHPLIVAEENGAVLGYASLSVFNAKKAYASTVELSVYVDRAARGRHVGLTLMNAILDLAREDSRTHRVVSLITSENQASIAMHKKLGFQYVGTLSETGIKFGRYLSVDFWELAV